MDNKMYQVSTLQALALGYSRAVITAGELIQEGDTGLGTFEDVNGEMIVMDGHCYRADQDGAVTVVAPETGVPFAAVAKLYGKQQFSLTDMPDIASVRTELTRKIEEVFGLNSMHIVRIDGEFEQVDARSAQTGSAAPRSPSHPHPHPAGTRPYCGLRRCQRRCPC